MYSIWILYLNRYIRVKLCCMHSVLWWRNNKNWWWKFITSLTPSPPSSSSTIYSERFWLDTLSSSTMYWNVQFSSVAQLCLTLCDPMNRSTPGLPVHHQLLESTQTHIHWVGDAIQPSHPLSSPYPALNLSQDQGLFKWVSSLHQAAKGFVLQLQHQSFQQKFRVDFPLFLPRLMSMVRYILCTMYKIGN